MSTRAKMFIIQSFLICKKIWDLYTHATFSSFLCSIIKSIWQNIWLNFFLHDLRHCCSIKVDFHTHHNVCRLHRKYLKSIIFLFSEFRWWKREKFCNKQKSRNGVVKLFNRSKKLSFSHSHSSLLPFQMLFSDYSAEKKRRKKYKNGGGIGNRRKRYFEDAKLKRP